MRECRLLNNNWKFTYGDQVTATSKEIASWQDIGIPHHLAFHILWKKNSMWDMELTQPGFHWRRKTVKKDFDWNF